MLTKSQNHTTYTTYDVYYDKYGHMTIEKDVPLRDGHYSMLAWSNEVTSVYVRLPICILPHAADKSYCVCVTQLPGLCLDES